MKVTVILLAIVVVGAAWDQGYTSTALVIGVVALIEGFISPFVKWFKKRRYISQRMRRIRKGVKIGDQDKIRQGWDHYFHLLRYGPDEAHSKIESWSDQKRMEWYQRSKLKRWEARGEVVLIVLAVSAFIVMDRMVEKRYQPENAVEYAVGMYTLLPDLVTPDDIHPRDFIAKLTGEDTGNSDAEVARNLKDETLGFLVELYGLPPGNVWRQEYDRRGLVMEVTPENIDHATLRWRVEGYYLEPGSIWRDEWDRRVSENPNLLEEVRAINPHTGQERPKNP